MPTIDTTPLTGAVRRRAGLWHRLLLTLAVVAGVLSVSAAPASAATAWPSHSSYTWTSYNGGVSNVRYCASDDVCGIKFTLGNNSVVYMLCWLDDDWAFGNSWSNRWFLIQTPGGSTGYIHSTLVQNQASSPNCGV